ncbi:MAG: copper homeostasis protein CutC [Alphaproteobacteria bacterium]|nr:copper homeostasis protein CutC [Alphaproteobacteria bacterium]
MTPLIELCVEGVDGAVTAAEAGADRVELCASLLEGGLTPSLGTLRATLAAVSIPVAVMVRPRGGDFLYSEREFASMLDDVARFRDEGAACVVFGCLNPDGTVDEARTARLAERASPAEATFHRAFDMTADPEAALEALIRCGVTRVLTSGQAPSGMQGLKLLKSLVEQADGRIIIMGCGALRPDTIGKVRAGAGLSELHFSAQTDLESGMEYRNNRLAMGATPLSREFLRLGTDPDLVRATIKAARASRKTA